MVITVVLTTQAVPTPLSFGLVFSSISHGLWLAATSSPLAMLMLSLLILMVVVHIYRALRWAPLTT